jgi:hypothetical protein
LICRSRENKTFHGVSVADINKDGILDIIAVGSYSNVIEAYSGLGRYSELPQWPQVGHDLLNSNNFGTRLIY